MSAVRTRRQRRCGPDGQGLIHLVPTDVLFHLLCCRAAWFPDDVEARADSLRSLILLERVSSDFRGVQSTFAASMVEEACKHFCSELIPSAVNLKGLRRNVSCLRLRLGSDCEKAALRAEAAEEKRRGARHEWHGSFRPIVHSTCADGFIPHSRLLLEFLSSAPVVSPSDPVGSITQALAALSVPTCSGIKKPLPKAALVLVNGGVYQESIHYSDRQSPVTGLPLAPIAVMIVGSGLGGPAVVRSAECLELCGMEAAMLESSTDVVPEHLLWHYVCGLRMECQGDWGITLQSTKVLVENCAVKGGKEIAISCSRTSALLRDNEVFGGKIGCQVEDESHVHMERNTFRDNECSGVAMFEAGVSCELVNNTFVANDCGGVLVGDQSCCILSHNKFLRNGFASDISVDEPGLLPDSIRRVTEGKGFPAVWCVGDGKVQKGCDVSNTFEGNCDGNVGVEIEQLKVRKPSDELKCSVQIDSLREQMCRLLPFQSIFRPILNSKFPLDGGAPSSHI